MLDAGGMEHVLARRDDALFVQCREADRAVCATHDRASGVKKRSSVWRKKAEVPGGYEGDTAAHPRLKAHMSRDTCVNELNCSRMNGSRAHP